MEIITFEIGDLKFLDQVDFIEKNGLNMTSVSGRPQERLVKPNISFDPIEMTG
jgi:hypothetical protein